MAGGGAREACSTANDGERARGRSERRTKGGEMMCGSSERQAAVGERVSEAKAVANRERAHGKRSSRQRREEVA